MLLLLQSLPAAMTIPVAAMTILPPCPLALALANAAVPILVMGDKQFVGAMQCRAFGLHSIGLGFGHSLLLSRLEALDTTKEA